MFRDPEFVLQVLSGIAGFVDFASIFAIIAVAGFYFFAPAAGYRADRRRTLGMALWILVASAALTLTNLMLVLSSFIDENKGRPKPSSDSGELYLVIVFFRGFLFFSGLVVFVIGLQQLERKDEGTQKRSPEPSVREEVLPLGSIRCRNCGQTVNQAAERCPNCKEPITPA